VYVKTAVANVHLYEELGALGTNLVG
jgi:hypothetical protein